MGTLEIWLVITGMTVVTIVTRSLFLIVSDRMTPLTRVQHVLRFALAAALVAIVLPDLLWSQDHLDASWTNLRLTAGTAATAFYVAARRMFSIIFVDMGVFTMLRPRG